MKMYHFQLLPHFVKEVFADSKGFCGLLLAILYSGSLRWVVTELLGVGGRGRASTNEIDT